MNLFVVQAEDGGRVQCSGPPAVLSLLRRGGFKLVEEQERNVERALRPGSLSGAAST
jgi:hypothetical protein